MNCKICKYEFCWICSGNWADHGQSTGGYYKCNRYEADPKHNSKSEADRAKAELDKYLHYYQRYHAHDMSLKFAALQREVAEKKMLEQQEATKASWIDVQFVKQAVEQVIECRRVLKFTYALGYFLNDDPGKQLFEHHQEMLEKNTDRLQEYTEEPLEKMDRGNIVNLTRVTEKFLESMLASATNDLIMGSDAALTSAAATGRAALKGEATGAASPTAPSRSSSSGSKPQSSPRVTRASSKSASATSSSSSSASRR
jgi:ariadne-1